MRAQQGKQQKQATPPLPLQRRQQQGKQQKQATPPLPLQRRQQQEPKKLQTKQQTQISLSKLKEKIEAMQELCKLLIKDTNTMMLMSQPYKDKDKDEHPMLTPNWFSPHPMLTPNFFSPPPVSSKTQLTPPQSSQTQQQKRRKQQQQRKAS